MILILGGVTSVGLEPQLQFKYVNTLYGTEMAEHWKIRNIWIGPSHLYLISMVKLIRFYFKLMSDGSDGALRVGIPLNNERGLLGMKDL